jgi:transposase
MVFSDYAKQRILTLYWKGFKISAIVEYLVLEDGIRVSKQGTRQFLKRYHRYKTIARKPGSGLPPKLSPAVQQLIETAMREDNETTATQLQELLARRYVYVSLATIVRNRRELGWIYRGSAYCQLIRNANKEKRLEFARTYLHDNFDDVIWSDETTVQLETHKRMCYRKQGEKPRPKPRAKHPVKVHVWGGISRKGATAVCIFEGIMTAPLYCDILERTLLPFIQEKFPPPSSYRFMQDNDPKHTSCVAKDFFTSKSINWWRTPPESPNMNPIENLWHELKEYIRCDVKPTNKDELVDGISQFWDNIDAHKCCKYIDHLKKVLPKVIEKNGEGTGY